MAMRRQPLRSRMRHLRPQLRARIIGTFAIGALVLSGLVAAVSYFSSRSTILGQAVNADELTAEGNARSLQATLGQQAALGQQAGLGQQTPGSLQLFFGLGEIDNSAG